MTAITLTEADRIKLPAPQYAGRHVYFRLQNTKVWRTNTLSGDGWPFAYEQDTDGFAYLLPEIKLAEPEKPPGMVLMKNAEYQSWCFCIKDKLALFYDKMSGYPLKNCTIVDNPHNDPTLAAAIRAAQEGK